MNRTVGLVALFAIMFFSLNQGLLYMVSHVPTQKIINLGVIFVPVTLCLFGVMSVVSKIQRL